MVKILYSVWIRIDETLPWIELKGAYQTRKEAKRAAEEALDHIKARIVAMPEKNSGMKKLATIKAAY